MRKTLATFMRFGAGLMVSTAAFAQSGPPMPAPMVTPPPAWSPSTEAQAVPTPVPASQLPPSSSGGVEFLLQGKQECILPGKHGDALADAEAGSISVETPTPDTLEVGMSGVVAAHCFIGCHSVGILTFQLVQEFDVTSSDPGLSQVFLTMEASLNGYVRSRHKGGACMRMASATIAPVGWPSTPLAVNFVPLCASGPGCSHAYNQSWTSPEGTPMPMGRYVLTANFVIEASADGLLNGHGVADFSSGDMAEGWGQENDPFKEADRGDYGFAINLGASAPAEGLAHSGRGPSVQIRPLTPQVRRVRYDGPAPVLRSAAR